MKSTQIVVCPSGPPHVRKPDNRYTDISECANQTGDGPAKLSYIVNDSELMFGTSGFSDRVKPISAIENTSGTIWMLDGQGDFIGHTAANVFYADGERYGQPQMACYQGADYRCVTARHLGGMNTAYYDGHVKWHPYSKLAPHFTSGGGPMTATAGD